MLDDFFIQLVLILLSARLLGEAVAQLKIPAVIGELAAGVLLGPSLLNWIPHTPTIELLAQIGVVLLLFEIGLETDLSKLVATGKEAVLAASAGVVGPLVLGFLTGYFLFNQSFLLALFIGGALTATSIGITMRVMVDLKQHQSREAQIVLGAAILDDIIGIILLAMLYEFSVSGAVNLTDSGQVLLFIALFLVTAPIAGKMISSLIKRYAAWTEIPGLLPTTIVSLILFFSWLAHLFSAPELLGGFAAGLALSKRFFLPLPPLLQTSEGFSHRVEEQMRPIVHLFTPIFFVNVGLTLNLREVAWDSATVWFATGVFFLVAIIGKLAAGFVLVKESSWTRWLVGIAMIPRGEVGLIFAEIGKSQGVLDQETYAYLILVIVFTTVLAPCLLRWLYTQTHSKVGF